MSLEGTATGKTLVGSIQRCDMLTISAYGVAVQNGFEGTVEEWLDSLKGEQGEKGKDGYTPVKGIDYFTKEDKQEIENLVLTSEKIENMAADIADLKYIPIKITSLTNNVGTVEMGTVVSVVTINWELNKEPVFQTLDAEELDAAVRTVTLTDQNISNTYTFDLEVYDERNAIDSLATEIRFYNGVYYGVLEDGAEVDSAAVLTMTRKLQGSKGITFTANAGAAQRIAYAIPTRYGTPNFNVGGFDGGFALAKSIAFTNASGYTESYDVWLSENVNLGSTTVKVS